MRFVKMSHGCVIWPPQAVDEPRSFRGRTRGPMGSTRFRQRRTFSSFPSRSRAGSSADARAWHRGSPVSWVAGHWGCTSHNDWAVAADGARTRCALAREGGRRNAPAGHLNESHDLRLRRGEHPLAREGDRGLWGNVEIEPTRALAIETDVLVLPGVGAFGLAAERLAPGRDAMQAALRGGLPCLGICLGHAAAVRRQRRSGA